MSMRIFTFGLACCLPAAAFAAAPAPKAAPAKKTAVAAAQKTQPKSASSKFNLKQPKILYQGEERTFSSRPYASAETLELAAKKTADCLELAGVEVKSAVTQFQSGKGFYTIIYAFASAPQYALSAETFKDYYSAENSMTAAAKSLKDAKNIPFASRVLKSRNGKAFRYEIYYLVPPAK